MSDTALSSVFVFHDVGQEAMVVRIDPEDPWTRCLRVMVVPTRLVIRARNTLTEKEDRQVALTQIRHLWAAESPPD